MSPHGAQRHDAMPYGDSGNDHPCPMLYGQVTGGFATAGAFWSSRFRDSMTVNVTIDLPTLPRGLLGWTDLQSVVVSYADVRTALTHDRTSPDDVTAVTGLPSGNSLSFLTNNTTNGALEIDDNDSANNVFLDVTRANMKALGFAAPGFLEPNDTVTDASILFSSAIPWDFDRTDGIASGTIDFVGVAIHELGHAMGFVSGVSTVDYYSAPLGPAADSTTPPTEWMRTIPSSRSMEA